METPKNIFDPNENKLSYAPFKLKPTKNRQRGKKKLFEPNSTEQIVNQLIEIIPAVVCRLKKVNLLGDFVILLNLINQNKFPLQNIAFLLLLEVARWYSLPNTSQMFYSSETMKFWKVLFRLFHGKALRFMSGTKSTGKLLSGSSVSGIFDSQETSINFAVPSAQRVSSYNPVDIDLPSELPAGIIQQAIDLKQTCNSYVLSVDGKKLAPGLNQKHGDQDLFGYEECESLEDQKFRIENEIGLVENIRLSWEHLPIDNQITNITNILALVSCRIKDLRILFKKQTLALRKFQKEAGDNWRTSRYVYAISSVQAMIFQIQVIVKRLLDVNNSLLKTGACLQSSQNMFVERNSIDSFTQKNWISLKEPDDLPDQYKGDIRFTKQRSDQWFEARKEFKVTGSKIFEGIGLDSLKALNKHFDKVIKKINIEEEFSDEAKQRMEHGTKCEIHAVATLVGKILPFYYPNLKFVEEGAHVLHTDNKPLVLVSPDGSLSQIEINSTKSEMTKLACEFKCPCPTDYKTPVHYEIPQRYVLILDQSL